MNDFSYHPQHIPLKWFNKNNGLDSGQVHNITQDKEGLIWFSGPSGLSRYNGNVLENFTKRVNLSSHGLRKVLANDNGQLFVATDRGIDAVRQGVCKPLTEQWTFGTVNDLAIHPKLGMLFAASEGLFLYKDNVINPVNSGHYDLVFVDQNGLIWTNNRSDGLKIYSTEFEVTHTEISTQLNSVKHINNGSDNVICVVTNDHLYEIRNHAIIRITYFKNITAALSLNNHLWLGIDSQLVRYILLDGLWKTPTTVNNDCRINQFFIDSFSNVWCATDQHGAIKISALKKLIYQPIFEQKCSVFCINKIDDQHHQIGGRNINKVISSENFHYFKDTAKLDNVIIWDQLQINDQLQLLATDEGLYANKQGQWQQLFIEDGYLSKQARILYRRQNQIWIGTRFGLTETRLDDVGNLHIIRQFDLGYVYCMDCDANGQLWIGTIGNGLFIEVNHEFIKHKLRYVKNQCSVYCIRFNSENSCAILHDNLISIHHDGQDSLLLSETETMVSGWSVVWDADTIWVGGINGLSQYNISKQLEIRNITALLTQANWEFTTSKSLALVNDRYLYCGLNSGLAVVDKQQLDEINQQLTTHLDEIIWENAEVSKTGQRDTLNPGKWIVQIKFYSTWYYNENNLKYRYKLIGFDDDWHETKQNYVQFNSLPIGQYKLIIQAFSPLKGWSETTTLYEFTVNAPTWARGWLNAVFGIFEVFSSVFSSKRKNSTLVQMNQQLESQLDQKNLEIKQAFSELRDTNIELHKEANHDLLTGMANRRSFQTSIDTALEISTRSNSPLALLLLDIDNFKSFNDKYGHDIGDLTLINVARIIESAVRKGDHASRFGGEEFAVILPHTSLQGAKIIAAKILQNVADFDPKTMSLAIDECITLSIGIGVFSDNNWETAQSADLIKQADQGLYLAKNNGKNQYQTVIEDADQ